MEPRIQKYIIDYFSHLESVYDTFKAKISDCRKITNKLCMLRERQKRLKKANVVNSPLDDFNNLIEKLSFEILHQINNVIAELKQHSHELYALHEELERKRATLENGCDQIDFGEKSTLVNGSAFQPRLSDLIEFSQDGVTFSLAVCAQIKYVICNITLNDSSSDLTDLNESFKIGEDTDKRIREILMLTQFCSKNETF